MGRDQATLQRRIAKVHRLRRALQREVSSVPLHRPWSLAWALSDKILVLPMRQRRLGEELRAAASHREKANELRRAAPTKAAVRQSSFILDDDRHVPTEKAKVAPSPSPVPRPSLPPSIFSVFLFSLWPHTPSAIKA